MTIEKHDALMAEIDAINKKIILLESKEREYVIGITTEILKHESEKSKLNKELMEGIKLIFPNWLNWLNTKEHKQ